MRKLHGADSTWSPWRSRTLIIALTVVMGTLILTAGATAREIDTTRVPQHCFLKTRNDMVYLALSVFVDTLGFKHIRYEKETRSMLVTGPLTIRLRIGDRWVEINDTPRQLSGPVLLVGHEVFMPARSFASTLLTTIKLPDTTNMRHLDDVGRVRDVRGYDEVPLMTQSIFFRRLIRKNSVTKEDVCRAVAIFKKRPESLGTFDQLVTMLKQTWIIPEEWRFERDDPAERGFACYLFIRALELKGGLSIRLFGLSGRSAYREAVDLGLTKAVGHRSRVTGGELMTILQQSSKLRSEFGLNSEYDLEGDTR